MIAARLHRRRADRDGGFTLSEMLVVIVLFGIIGTIIATTVRMGLKHQTQLQDRNAAFAGVREVIQRVDRDIRAANPLESASATQIQLYENEGASAATGQVVTYAVVATSSTTAELTYNAGDGSATRTLITNLVQTSTNPIFSFSPASDYAANQTTAQSLVTNASTCAIRATPTQYDPSCVGMITVHLMAQPSTINQPVNVSDNGTELRNAT